MSYLYFDYAASTPVDPRVTNKMIDVLNNSESCANPGSLHYYGVKSQNIISEARINLEKLINAPKNSIIWTSGATESINLAIKGIANYYKHKGNHIITTKTEHKAVLATTEFLELKGFEVTYLDVDKEGLINIRQLEDSITDKTILVSILHVNNETGIVQDIVKIGKLLKDKSKDNDIVFHVDGAQSVGKVPIDVQEANIDLLSITGHKFYGPKGIGALYKSNKIRLEPLIHGGGQQYNFRSGTLPTQQIAGLGMACQIANLEMTKNYEHITKLRNKFIEGLKKIDNVVINTCVENSFPGVLSVSFKNLNANMFQNIAVSSGSACSSVNIEPSHVLTAMGINSSQAANTIRFSFGACTLEKEVDSLLEYIKKLI